MSSLYSLDNLNKEALESFWHSRLREDYPDHNLEKRQSIIRWLLGEELERCDRLTSRQLAIAEQIMDYRYRILQQRYLEVESDRAYYNLIARLGSLMMLCHQIRAWVASSQQRKKTLASLIQAAIEEMLKSDLYIKRQIDWIGKSTRDRNLRDALVLCSLEEYCMRPIRSQPAIADKIRYFLLSQYAYTTPIAIGQNGR
ncbi:MAG: hypothetical protein MUD14_30065 [Hydrococcus sp. Prado102]|nr:hypothetical protein [Hydrococcus sp. Prado102]